MGTEPEESTAVAEPEVVDADVVEEPGNGHDVVPGTELAPAPMANQGPPQELATLWGSKTPGEIVEQAADVAKHLNSVLEQSGMTTSMGGDRKHVNIEGWQTCGTLLGLQGLTISTRRVEPTREFKVTSTERKWGKVDGKRQVVSEKQHEWMAKGYSYECVAEIRTMDGRVVGRGEALCSREESKWMTSEDSAVKGMAQTRAHSRAFRQALGFIVGMAGYNATPTEEMAANGVEPQAQQGPPHGPPLKDADKRAIRDQVASIFRATPAEAAPPQELANGLLGQVKGNFDYVPFSTAWALDLLAKMIVANTPPDPNGDDGGLPDASKDAKAQEQAGEEDQAAQQPEPEKQPDPDPEPEQPAEPEPTPEPDPEPEQTPKEQAQESMAEVDAAAPAAEQGQQFAQDPTDDIPF